MITHCRIDQRLIHGQTQGVLMTQIPCEGIIIVDDDIANDPFLSSVFKGVVPNHIKVFCFGIEKALIKLKEAVASGKKYFVIYKHPTTLAELVKRGYFQKGRVTVGPQHAREGTSFIIDGLYLTQEEIEALNYLTGQGIEIEVQPVLTVKCIKWSDLSKKINTNNKEG